jgi:hypothetical protein
MHEQTLNIVIAIISTLIGVMLSIIAPNQVRIIDSVYLGIFSYLTSVGVQLAFRSENFFKLNKVSENTEDIVYFLRLREYIASRSGKLSEQYLSFCLFKAYQGIYRLENRFSFEVSKIQIPNFWLQSITNTESAWFCTNYVNPRDDWGKGWVRRGLYFQKLQAEEYGQNIKRVFIFKNESEITKVHRERMLEQKEFGIQAKWATLDADYLQWKPFEQFRSLIGTEDLALVDGVYLIAFFLDEKRHHQSILCIYDNEILSKISSLYGRLWDESRSLEDLPKI